MLDKQIRNNINIGEGGGANAFLTFWCVRTSCNIYSPTGSFDTLTVPTMRNVSVRGGKGVRAPVCPGRPGSRRQRLASTERARNRRERRGSERVRKKAARGQGRTREDEREKGEGRARGGWISARRKVLHISSSQQIPSSQPVLNQFSSQFSTSFPYRKTIFA